MEIGTEACYRLETLYLGDETYRHVEDIAFRRNSFPILFSNPSTIPAKAHWSGNDMRESLKLAPQVLKKSRAMNAKMTEEDLKTHQWLRYWFSMFANDIMSLQPRRTDIKARTRVRLRNKKNDVGAWVKEFTKWMRRENPRMVKSRKGRFHAEATKRMEKLQTSTPKADIWDGFSQIVRDKIKASILAL